MQSRRKWHDSEDDCVDFLLLDTSSATNCHTLTVVRVLTVMMPHCYRSSLLLTAIIAFVISLSVTFVHSSAASATSSITTHLYSLGDSVILWSNKVGPYHNPSESYPYDTLPICSRAQVQQQTLAGATARLDQKKHAQEAATARGESLTILLEGDTLIPSGIAFPFRRNVADVKVCDLILNDPELISTLEGMTQQHYWYQLALDDLPLFGMVGEWISEEEMKKELEEQQSANAAGGAASTSKSTTSSQPVSGASFVYTHRDYSISYNNGRIIEVNLTSENPRPLLLGAKYPITYSVEWTPTTKDFEDRYERYVDSTAFSQSRKIHWFGLLNSFMLVIFLCALVLLILSRTIKNGAGFDLESGSTGSGGAAYRSVSTNENAPSSSAPGQDEAGWRLLSGDVFRAPSRLLLYSVLLGTGCQLFLLLLASLLLTFMFSSSTSANMSNPDERSVLFTSFLFLYSISSIINGAVNGWYFKLHASTIGPHAIQQWKRSVWMGIIFYPSFLFFILIALEILAFNQGTYGIIDASNAGYIISVWAILSVPLNFIGALWARAQTVQGAFPSKVNAIKRLIPSDEKSNVAVSSSSTSSSITHSYTILLLMSGLLPFGSIFIEMYFILTSFWNHAKFFYLYGFLFLVFLIYLLTTISISIVSTYILLNSEDYRWHWFSFLASSSSCLYIGLYSIYFFLYKTNMDGVLQATYYFAFVTVLVFTLALVTGAIGALGTRVFVSKIYGGRKAD